MYGKAIIVSAPSGAGKTTIVHHLMDKFPTLRFSISATTRAPRKNEKNGEDYYFLGKQDFDQKIVEGHIMEWQEVYEGKYYGTLRSEVEKIWNEGNHVIFDVEVIGAMNLKKEIGDQALSIFVKVGDLEVLRERLIKRETETEDSVDRRIQRAIMEMKEEDKFDEVIVNHNLDQALKQAEDMVRKFLA